MFGSNWDIHVQNDYMSENYIVYICSLPKHMVVYKN